MFKPYHDWTCNCSIAVSSRIQVMRVWIIQSLGFSNASFALKILRSASSSSACGVEIPGLRFVVLAWFEGNSTGNHGFYRQSWEFPVGFPFPHREGRHEKCEIHRQPQTVFHALGSLHSWEKKHSHHEQQNRQHEMNHSIRDMTW